MEFELLGGLFSKKCSSNCPQISRPSAATEASYLEQSWKWSLFLGESSRSIPCLSTAKIVKDLFKLGIPGAGSFVSIPLDFQKSSCFLVNLSRSVSGFVYALYRRLAISPSHGIYNLHKPAIPRIVLSYVFV